MTDITEYHEAAQALAMYWDLHKNGGMSKKHYNDIKKLISIKLAFGDKDDSKVEKDIEE